MKKILTTLSTLVIVSTCLNAKPPSTGKIGKENKTRVHTFIALKQNINPNKKARHEVVQISHATWNDGNGLPYRQVAGANLGTTSFALIDKNKTAFLSDATNEIITVNNTDGNVLRKFKISFAPRDFVYDAPYFYVLTGYNLSIYNDSGVQIKEILLPRSYIGVERVIRYNKATYLLLPTGNSLKIEQGGSAIEPKEHVGWITSPGVYVKTQLNGGNSYSVNIITSQGNLEKKFVTDKKVAGVFVVGANLNRVVLDIQLYVSENPISIERHIVAIEKNKNLIGDILADTKVPDCYYVLANKDFYLAEDGSIYNMLTAPTGMFFFSLKETSTTISKSYPIALSTIKYHFNDHLLRVEK